MKRFKRQIASLLIVSMLFNSLLATVAMAADEPGFTTDELLQSGIDGMFDPSCGGYCVVGACAHLVVRITLHGVEYYTIVSPKIRHAVPDLVISSYNHIGSEPWLEWRDYVGGVLDEVNTGPVARVLGVTDGLRGGQQLYTEHGSQQSVIFKEVDIIGHPAAIIPQIAKTNGDIDSEVDLDYELPSVGRLPSTSDARAEDSATPDDGWSLEGMLDSGFNSVMEILLDRLEALLEAFDIVRTIERIVELFDMFSDLLNFYNNAMALLETITRGSIYGNLINPRFRADRLFCPSTIRPFQPYYLSYLDTLFWRTGFPITDGPISGANHSTTILNPLSGDSLGSSGEVWGHLYPRDGAVNQHIDPKAATVLAVRAHDVLHNDISSLTTGSWWWSHTTATGVRVGVSLPEGYPAGGGAWQMIFPVKRECRADPFYSDDSVMTDFMEENSHGGYAWNYYHIYTCCMNERGHKVLEVDLPEPICFPKPI